MNGNVEVLWTDEELTECLLAIAFYLSITESIDRARKADPSLTFLNQLKFFFVALFGHVCKKEYDSKRIHELVNGEKAFEKESAKLWKAARFVVTTEWQRNIKNAEPMTLRTFARSHPIWESIREAFDQFRLATESS
jgi:hypothetical protein